MARKILNRKELREENDAAEAAEGPGRGSREEEGSGQAKDRAKVHQRGALKAFWGIFNQSLRRISVFDYSHAEADQKAAELARSQKTPHFVQLVKEVIEESHRASGRHSSGHPRR